MVHTHKFGFKESGIFSKRDWAYADSPEIFESFYNLPPQLSSFEKLIHLKSENYKHRELFVSELREQYKNIQASEATLNNIEKLAQTNTFCITTAHQPSLLTGPLFYVYKILSAIKLAKHLNQKLPSYHFVPLFISGSEDHDFEEVNHFKFFRDRISWEDKQEGPVGRYKLTTLIPLLNEIKEKFGNSTYAESFSSVLDHAIQTSDHYAQFVLQLVNGLFKSYGLVILNMDNANLKRAAIPLFKEELTQECSKPLVLKEQEKLEKIGYKAQAFARDINLFYLGENSRDRIEKEDGVYRVVNSDISFSEASLFEHLESNPERFSPNVVLRPVYQEFIVPNLAYIGGGGEIAYWLERKTQFKHFGVTMPILLRRNSAIWIDKSVSGQIQKLGLEIMDFFQHEDVIINKYVERQAEQELSFESEIKEAIQVLDSIIAKSKDIDPTLAKSFSAEKVKVLKSLHQMEGRMKRAEKSKHEININKIRKIKAKLFPNNSLQERVDNFLPYYLKYGPSYFDLLLGGFETLVKSLVVFEEQ